MSAPLPMDDEGPAPVAASEPGAAQAVAKAILATALPIVAAARAAGATVEAIGGRLTVDDPTGAVGEDLWQSIRNHRAAILAYLQIESLVEWIGRLDIPRQSVKDRSINDLSSDQHNDPTGGRGGDTMAAVLEREREAEHLVTWQPTLDLDLPPGDWGQALQDLQTARAERRNAEAVASAAKRELKDAREAEEAAILRVVELTARARPGR